jgi:twinkle protein
MFAKEIEKMATKITKEKPYVGSFKTTHTLAKKVRIKCAKEVESKLKNVKVVKSDVRKYANEILFYDGPEKILELINEAINKMPDGLIDASSIHYTSVEDEAHTGIETGFYDYDSHVNDWKEQEITIVVGRNGEGKTTFISQVIAHCLEKNVKTFLYSGEMSDNKLQRWIYRQLIGNKTEFLKHVKTKYQTVVDVKQKAVAAIKEWHKETFYLFDRNVETVSKNLENFFALMDIAAKRYNCKLFVIDNLMSKLEENADSLFSDQANFVQRCKEFAINNNCHVVILVHPNKSKGEITNEPNIEKTDISGSNNIPNKADNIISVERNWNNDREFDAVITSLKDRETGERKSIKYMFSKKTLRFYNNNTKEEQSYGWIKHIQGYQEVNNWVQSPIKNCPF